MLYNKLLNTFALFGNKSPVTQMLKEFNIFPFNLDNQWGNNLVVNIATKQLWSLISVFS